MTGCPFCNISTARFVGELPTCVAVRDLYPVTEHHTLIVPKRHAPTYFDLTDTELSDVHQLTKELRDHLKTEDLAVSGFNIGWNCGKSAGQTVMHAHLHLIPRRDGDSEDPRGGVRGVIPMMQQY